MPTILDRPIFTETFPAFEGFRPTKYSTYVFGTSVEDRSAHSAVWGEAAKDVNFVKVIEQGDTTCVLAIGNETISLPLRNRTLLNEIWKRLSPAPLYIDITGLSHHIWAPLIKSAIELEVTLRVVYVEPEGYRFSNSPTEGAIFDLSQDIMGISPLPGFTTLRSQSDDFLFVPLVGFEGARLSYVLEQVQPLGDRIYPVVGVPGFRPEYPFHAYLGNRLPFSNTKAWRNVHFARANCPFSLFYALSDIVDRSNCKDVRVAPIGTKPHSLGAVLFYISGAHPIEIIYDHPIRKRDRTSGSSRVSVYHVSSFVRSFSAAD
jgi:hypothetical protein